MKKLLLILLGGMFFLPQFQVEAKESFYDAEYIPNIYMIRERQGTRLYQQARFIRKQNSREIAYCIEPFAFLDDRHDYQQGININELDDEIIEQISLISYFGYQYQNHQEDKWYAVTQLLIWKTADPYASFYFTNGLNGELINPYLEEEKEILSLVENANKLPSFHQEEHTILINDEITLEDTNHILENFSIESNLPIKKEKNLLIINQPKEEGEYQITLTRKFNQYHHPAVLYRSNINQDILTLGDAKEKIANLKIHVIPSEVKVNKIDEMEELYKGDAILSNVIFGLYDNNGNLMNKFTIDENLTTTISNLPSGSYIIKELLPGIGYQLNSNEFHFTLNGDNPKVEITIPNQLIKGKLVIHKQYGKENNWINEDEVTFLIYNKDGELVSDATTNSMGILNITLPFGEYTIVQQNTIDGYQMVDSFQVVINENEKEYFYHLKDYKIDVPDTSSFIPKIFSIESDEKKKPFTNCPHSI